ncbi:hypothetical protein M3650_15620 [Paenibacillus sp. MER TA 81-3]|uniref:hypothetical protein n=1 Tax=Paenibacillus sp. MER TA 81-3 TaxID=2939573 RepID=UPI002040220C|nr:hypothetical protein [Paenibacillus sp. MER TA 81-3]MCM3340022.1 hypothetical protein [Paenibacillus sp. MER TA 81-3]
MAKTSSTYANNIPTSSNIRMAAFPSTSFPPSIRADIAMPIRQRGTKTPIP